MSLIADGVRAVLVPFLAVTGTLLLLLVCQVLVLHAAREAAFRRRDRLRAHYRPVVDEVLHGDDPESAVRELGRVPRRHLVVLTGLLLEPLRAVKGHITDRARGAAAALGLLERWEAGLKHRRWWIRAEAAAALGLMQHRPAVPALLAALDDPYEEVRAAAVEALGRVGDRTAIPELVARFPEQSRHQRVRLVEALQRFGASAAAPLLAHAQQHPVDVPVIAELLGSLEAPDAVPTLLAWCGDERPEVRAAAVRAVGAIGVDERAFYHVLRALSDAAAHVRAAAAWSLGRSGREDAVSYLAPRLRDEWMVAAQSARALGALGAPGRRALEAAAAGSSELARQILWECGAARA